MSISKVTRSRVKLPTLSVNITTICVFKILFENFQLYVGKISSERAGNCTILSVCVKHSLKEVGVCFVYAKTLCYVVTDFITMAIRFCVLIMYWNISKSVH